MAVVEIFDIVVVSDRGMEANAPCARHREEGLTFDKLKGLRRLEEALGENAGCTTDGGDEGCMALLGGYGRAIFAYFDWKMENSQ